MFQSEYEMSLSISLLVLMKRVTANVAMLKRLRCEPHLHLNAFLRTKSVPIGVHLSPAQKLFVALMYV